MVEKIEHIERKLHSQLFADREILAEAPVSRPERQVAEIVDRLHGGVVQRPGKGIARVRDEAAQSDPSRNGAEPLKRHRGVSLLAAHGCGDATRFAIVRRGQPGPEGWRAAVEFR